ncbi:MAG TPA: DUF2291 domain-containing protein [Gemmatimonadaceae bacterium]|nr:DUF2291 domain-containing protein [Gemmatimonadaceae bacterium]
MQVVFACAILLLGAGCKIVYDDERERGAAGGGGGAARSGGFDAAAWSAEVWETKVLAHFAQEAVGLPEVLGALQAGADEAGEKFGRRADAEGSPWSFTVRGKGRVKSVNTQSRAGTVVVAVDTPSGPQEVTLQIGPVVRGTAVRDSLPFFGFGDVTNQIEFAQVARALNQRAVAGLKEQVEGVEPGTVVEFTGAMNVSGADDPVLITPITLKRAGEG